MKVVLKILLPTLPEAIGGSDLEVDLMGKTVNDVIEFLIAQYGQSARKALLNDNGNLDPVVQILLNGEEWVAHDRLDMNLKDGDSLMFMIMMAGG
jgi:MoaD family protein